MKTIALITDFGTQDGYVGAIKGRILSECDDHIHIIDISHQIKSFNTHEAAFCLNSCYEQFPKGTIFTITVDPGVGTSRKVLVLKTDNYTFVGPDNDIFQFIYLKEKVDAYEVLLDQLEWEVCPTFHGRDVFAPISALIASDKLPAHIIKKTSPHIKELKIPNLISPTQYELDILHIDNFGNIILNFHKKDWIKIKSPKDLYLMIDDLKIKGITTTFGQVHVGSLLITWESSGYLQISQNQGSAKNSLKIDNQTQIILHLSQ